MLKIRTAKGPVTFADDPEFVKYGCLGYIRNTKLRVIYQSEPYSEVCYLVDTVSARTDTFVSKLWFYTDKASFACLESKPSDRPQVIQVGQLANGSIKNKKNYTLSGDITPNQIFWADKNTLFIADGKAHYWKVNL